MLKGSIVALVTPMTDDNAVDYESLSRLCEWHIEQGTDGFVVCGSTGEAVLLTRTEYAQVIATVVTATRKRVPVIAGIGSPGTTTCLELAAEARKQQVDALLCVTPYYVRPSQQGLIKHFKALAESGETPILLYNVPSRSGVDLLPESVYELAKLDNIIGIKEATGNLDRARELFNELGDQFIHLSGDDPTACEYILSGGHGVISVTANIVPKAMAKMCAYASLGERENALNINDRLIQLHKSLFLEPSPAPSKWLLQRLGHMESGIRPPLLPLSDRHEQNLLAAYQRASTSID